MQLFRMRNNTEAAGAAPRKRHRLIYLLSVAQRRVQRAVATSSGNAVSPAQAGLLFVLGRQNGVPMGRRGLRSIWGRLGSAGWSIA